MMRFVGERGRERKKEVDDTKLCHLGQLSDSAGKAASVHPRPHKPTPTGPPERDGRDRSFAVA